MLRTVYQIWATTRTPRWSSRYVWLIGGANKLPLSQPPFSLYPCNYSSLGGSLLRDMRGYGCCCCSQRWSTQIDGLVNCLQGRRRNRSEESAPIQIQAINQQAVEMLTCPSDLPTISHLELCKDSIYRQARSSRSS